MTIATALAPFVGLFAALAAGLLVGLERGWNQRLLPEGHRVAGFRTFGLIGLAGGVAGLMPDWVAAALALGIAGTLVAGYLRSASAAALSSTTTIAAILTFGIGFIAERVDPVRGLAAAATVYALLSARTAMHALLKGLEQQEIDAVARFALIALVVLPLLPDTGMGPFDAWNPRRIWLVVVLVTGLSLAGYVAARKFGANRGTMVVALTGALVSSTAVTADFARRMRVEPEAARPLTAGIALASIVMFVRVQVLTAALVPAALPTLALAMAPATLVAAGWAALAWRRGQDKAESPAVRIGNPFDFAPALMLAGVVALLSVLARWALAEFGNRGMAVVLGLTGLMDVDAAVLTLAGLPHGTIEAGVAGVTLAIPVIANTLIKGGLTIVIAGWRRGLGASLPLFASSAASIAFLALYHL